MGEAGVGLECIGGQSHLMASWFSGDTLTRGGWGTFPPRLHNLGEVICSHSENGQRLLGPQNDRSRLSLTHLHIKEETGSERSGVCLRWQSGAEPSFPTPWGPHSPGHRAAGAWRLCQQTQRAPQPVGSLVLGELHPCSRSSFSWAR